MTASGLETAQRYFADLLQSLKPSGADGFEGAIAGMLGCASGQTFRVSKSGPQGGSDARTERCNLVQIGMEAKRYKQATSLPLDSLKSKIADAAMQEHPVDLWILAATREISATDREQLQQQGEAVGISVLVLDWPAKLERLHDLSILCALGTAALSTFASDKIALQQATDVVLEQPDFETKREALVRRLTCGDVGYDSARRASSRWMLDAQSSLANAKSRLGGHHDLSTRQDGVVPRAAVNMRLHAWYGGSAGVVALLGDEGLGKSWAALDWNNSLGKMAGGAPLTVYLKSTAINPSDVRQSIARALRDQTDVGTVAFWQKRLKLWERHGGDAVHILLVIDGLNENFQFTAWADWLQPLFETGLRGMFRVIVSCWPDWWENTLASCADLIPRAVEVRVERFDDEELDRLIAVLRMQRSEIASGVLELMRVPRLSMLVAAHREALKSSGDISAERVIYEDWKHRLSLRGGRVGLSDAEMKIFVSDLGKQLAHDIDQAFTKREVIEHLSRDSGKDALDLKPAIGELTSGSWLEPGERPNTFKVSKKRIPFALGAALVDQFERADNVMIAQARIATFLDPLKAHSLGAAILRCATAIALIEPDTPHAVREALLDRWLAEQNFNNRDFETFWRLGPLGSSYFLDLAESRWLNRETGGFIDEVLIKTLANASETSSFKADLMERMRDWVGQIWAAPLPGDVVDAGEWDSPAATERAAIAIALHKQWQALAIAKTWPPIRFADGKARSWLTWRALAVLSYLRRSDFIDIFGLWAIGRAIMGWTSHGEQIAWILRANDVDPVEGDAALLSLVAKLLEAGDGISRKAAENLQAALSAAHRHTERLSPPNPKRRKSTQPQLPEAVSESDIVKFAKMVTRPSSWHGYSPDDVTRVFHQMANVAPTASDDVLDFIVADLWPALLMFSDSTREVALDRVNARILDPAADMDESSREIWRHSAFVMKLFGQTPAEQCRSMLDHGLELLEGWNWVLDLLDPADIGDLDLGAASNRQLAVWLDYLFVTLREGMGDHLRFLDALVQHESRLVSLKALQLATAHGRKEALRLYPFDCLADTPPLASKNEDTNSRLVWEIFGLLKLHENNLPPDVRSRLPAETTAIIAGRDGAPRAEIETFHAYLREQFHLVASEKSWAYPHYWKGHQRAVEALLDIDAKGLRDWLDPWASRTKTVIQFGMIETFPIIDTMNAMASTDPETAYRLFEILEASKSSVSTNTDLKALLFKLPDTPQWRAKLDATLANTWRDSDLLALADLAYVHGRENWLSEAIDRLESGHKPADVARAYTLLGFTNPSEDADQRWIRFRSRPPSDKWLARVFATAQADFQTNIDMRDAFARFWEVDEDAEALWQLNRIKSIADNRLLRWTSTYGRRMRLEQRRRRLVWQVAAAQLKDIRKADTERRKKKLFHTPLAFSTMRPWA